MMKSKTLLLAISCCISLIATAQLKVNTNGNIGIGTEPSNSYQLKVEGNSQINGWVDISSLHSSSITTEKISTNSSNAITKYLEIPTDYYDPTIRIYASSYYYDALSVYGCISYTGSVYQSSDKRLKNDIKNLEGLSVLERMELIDAQEYNFKSQSELSQLKIADKYVYKHDTINIYSKAKQILDQKRNDNPVYEKKAKEWNTEQYKKEILRYAKEMATQDGVLSQLNDSIIICTQAPAYDTTLTEYGFIAQELLPVFPELVRTDPKTGLYSVKYMAFIPILYQAVKELRNENEKLTQYLGLIADESISSKSAKSGTTQIENKTIEAENSEASMSQNRPNPFSENTIIDYSLPVETKSAQINIYDLNGRQLKTFQLNTSRNSITIDGGDLYAGLFNYVLIVDGELIDTKRMILTE